MPQIRLAPSGAPIIGNNPGDLLVWDGTEWVVMPGGGGGVLMGDADGAIGDNRVTSLSQVGLGVELVPISSLASSVTEVSVFVLDVGGTDFFTIPLSVLLAATALNGDADGPAGNNRVTSLSEVGLGVELQPITSLAPSGSEISFLVAPIGGGSLFLSPASSALAGFEGAFDFVLKSRADLLAVPGVGAGPVFNLPSGSYAIKVGFALNAGESLAVLNGIRVLMMGMGRGKVIDGTVAAPLLDVQAGGEAVLYSLNLVNSTNVGRAVQCAGTVNSFGCLFQAGATGGTAALMLDGGEWHDFSSRFVGGTSHAISQTGGRLQLAGSVLTSLSDALECTGATAMFCQCDRVQATSSADAGVLVSGANVNFRGDSCDFSGLLFGLNQSAGIVRCSDCTITATGIAVNVTGGNGRYTDCDLLPTNGECLSASGASAYVQRLIGCNCFNSIAAQAVLWNAAAADLFCTNTQFNAQQNDAACIRVNAASTIQVMGGRMQTSAASRGSGVRIAGNIAGGLQVEGVHGEDISTSDASGEGLVQYISGTVRRAIVMGCDTATTVATAINWAAANIPTLGLVVVGNAFDDPSPLNGFTHTSARVNSKANLLQTGLMSETPIVP